MVGHVPITASHYVTALRDCSSCPNTIFERYRAAVLGPTTYVSVIRVLRYLTCCEIIKGGGQNKVHLAGIWPKQGEG